MDYSKGKDYCAALTSGISEHEIARNEQLTLSQLYRIIEFTDIDVAGSTLNIFATDTSITCVWHGRVTMKNFAL